MSVIALPVRAARRARRDVPNPAALAYGRHRSAPRVAVTSETILVAARAYQAGVWGAVVVLALMSHR